MIKDFDALSQEAERVVRSMELPPCPAILAKLVREMRNDEPDLKRFDALISSDMGLAAALLKTVNSPFYGLQRKATSIRQALAVTGLVNAMQLVTGLLLRQVFPVGASAQMEELWEYSGGIARASTCLARHVRGLDRDMAHTFGLFRDCGMIGMLSTFKDYRLVHLASDAGAGLLTDGEVERYGIHHGMAGFRLAREWFLPDPVCQAVRWHHDYVALQDGQASFAPPAKVLIALALAAEHAYAQHVRGSASGEWSRHGAFALEQLGMEEADLEAAMPEVIEALQEAP